MRKNLLLALALMAVGSYATAVAEEWGDTSYVNPPQTEIEVEELPSSVSEPIAANDSVTTSAATSGTTSTVMSEDLLNSDNEKSYASDEAEAAKPAKSLITNISTQRNTYGVETEEKPGLKLYVSPFAGISSVVGNTTADASAKYAAGVGAGLLISRNMMIEASYTYSEQNLSNPRYSNSSLGIGVGSTNVFAMKSNSFDAGVKLFFLGRESRLRPYFGGGMGYTKSYLNYTTDAQARLNYGAQYASDYVTDQVMGFGQLGAEFAITKSIVVNVEGKLAGVFSSNTSANDNIAAQTLDSSKIEVGNSLSRTASYTVAAGVGFYF